MAAIDDALAEADTYATGEKIPWQKIANKHGVVRSTLTRRHRAETRSREDQAIAQQNLNPQQEEELVKYIGLTARRMPPTRDMICERLDLFSP